MMQGWMETCLVANSPLMYLAYWSSLFLQWGKQKVITFEAGLQAEDHLVLVVTFFFASETPKAILVLPK